MSGFIEDQHMTAHSGESRNPSPNDGKGFKSWRWMPFFNAMSGICLLALTACTQGPSHIPPIHQLPGAAISSVIENTAYKNRRNKVKAAIQPHYDFIMTDVSRGGGTSFDMACHAAKVNPPKCQELLAQISKDDHIYQTGTIDERIEKLTVAFMVYGT